MSVEDDLKKLEKEFRILKRKFDRSLLERDQIEIHLNQTRHLLTTEAKERLASETEKQLSVFKKFVPKEFMRNLNKADWLDIQLGDQSELDMTVLFTDIRSFTTLSEKMTSQETFKFINRFLHFVYPSILLNKGFVNLFIGDAILALFNEPRNAIQAGIDMQRSVEKFNEERKQEGKDPIEMGIGLNVGKLMLGIIGVEDRLQGTVLSDAVNVASRVESLTKRYGSALILSEAVLHENLEFLTRFLGKVAVAGKTKAIKIYEILLAETKAVYEMKKENKLLFEEGLQLYFDKMFPEASLKFSRSLNIYPHDKAALFYLKNCASFMVEGVPESWDGIEFMKEK